MLEEHNYFTPEEQEVTDYFDSLSTRPPMNTQRASEAGSATGVLLTEEISPETAEVAEGVRSNLEVLGSDPLMQQTIQQERDDWKAAILTAGSQALIEEEDLEEGLRSIGAAEKSVSMMSDRAVLNVSAADKLQNPNKDYGFLFEDAMNSSMIDSAMSSMIDKAISDTPIDFDDWADVFFTSPVTERSFRAEVLDPLGLHEGVGSYSFRTGDEEKVVNWLRSASTPEEQVQRLQMFIDQATESEHFLGDNGIFSISFLEQVRDQINYGDSNAIIDDFFDAFALFDVGSAVTGVKYLASRWLGTASIKTGGFDSGASAGIRSIVQEAADSVLPVQREMSGVAKAVRSSLSSSRTNKGSLGDLMYQSNPDAIKALLSATPDTSSLRALGMTPEDLAARVSPAQADDTRGMHSSVLTGEMGTSPITSAYSTVIDVAQRATLYTPAEQMRGIEREVARVQEQSTGVLQPQHTIIPDIDESTDVLTFGAVFGKSATEGYETLQDAEYASSFLFGADNYKVLAKKKGSPDAPTELLEGAATDGMEFFVRADLQHTLVPMDANPFKSGDIWGSKPILGYLMPWSSRITSDIFNSASAFTDRTSAIVQEVTDSLTPIRKLKGDSEKEDWTKLLVHGDQHSMDFTRPMAEKYLGRMNDRVWDAYTSARRYFGIMHDVRNKKEYLRLSADGFQSLRGPDGSVLTDRKGAVFGVPVNKLPDAKEMLRADGTVAQVTEDTLNDVIEAGGIIVRTNRDVTLDGDTYFSHMIIPDRGDVVKLTNHPLTKRKGHVDVMYRSEDSPLSQQFGGHKGGTGYIVTKERAVFLDGKESVREETIGIFANKPQAQKFVQKQEEEGFFIKPSREKKAELGLDEAVGLTGLPSHAMGRGDRLQGPSGLAEILDPAEAISATQNEIRKRLGSDYIDLIKSRFMAKYSKIVQRQKGATGGINYPTSVKDIKVRDEFADSIPELEAEYRFIQNQERGLTGKLTVEWMEAHKRANEALFNTNTPINRTASRVQGVVDPKWLKFGAQINQLTAITGRPIYQMVANSTQAAFMGMRDPKIFFSQTVPRTFSTVMGLAIMRGGKEGSEEMLSLLAKPFGMEAQDFKRYLQQVQESGVTATGISDDIFSLITNGVKVQAGDFSAASSAFWKKLPSHTVKAANYAPEVATKLANLMAYVHATNLNMTDNVQDIFKPRIKDKIAGESRKLSYTQNRMDQLSFQQNSWAIPLQFTQHVMKMAWSMMVEPSFKAITGRNIGQQGAAIFAETRAKSTFLMMSMLGTFGIRPLMSDDKAAALADAGLNEEFETLVLDGWLNVGANAIWGEKFDFAHGYSPLSFYSQLADFFISDDGGVNVLGPTQMTGKNLFKVYDWARTHHDNPSMTSEEFYSGVLHRATRMFSTMRDIDKAKIAYNYGKFVTSSGRPVAEVDPSVSMFALFNVPSQKEQLFYEDQGTFADNKEFADKITDMAMTEFMRELSDNPNMSGEEIQQHAIDILYKAVYPAIGQENQALYEYAKDRYISFLFSEDSDFLERYATKLFQMSKSPDDAINKLNRFAEMYPQFQDRVDYQVQILEREIENAKGEK